MKIASEQFKICVINPKQPQKVLSIHINNKVNKEDKLEW